MTGPKQGQNSYTQLPLHGYLTVCIHKDLAKPQKCISGLLAPCLLVCLYVGGGWER